MKSASRKPQPKRKYFKSRGFSRLFCFSWEQRKVGEVSESYSGGTPSVGVKEYYGGQIPFIRSAEINSEITELFLTEEGLKNSSARLVAVGDILYALYGATSGEVGRARLKGAINQAILAIKPHTDYDSEYLAQWLRKSKHSIIETYLQGGQGNLSGTIVKKLSVDFPSLKEQKAIGDFFRQLDNLITLHQRNSIMRFPGAWDNDNAWEQRKLSEMCGTFEYGLNAAAKEFDGKNKYIRITDIDDASREFLLSDLSSPDICLDGMSKYLLSSGDIVFARTGASVGKTYIYRENDGIVYFAGFLIRAKVNQDNDAEFVFQSTLSPSYEKYIRITSQRSGQPGVNAQEYSEYDLFAPSKEEQQRIGHFLRGIDHLITLHQRQPFLHSPPDISLIVQLTPPFYTFSWEQRKLGDMMNVTSVKRIHQSDWTDSGVRFLRARDIVAAAKNEEPDDYLYISKEKYEEYSALSGKVGVSDLLVTGVGTIGVPYLVRNLEPLYFKDGNIIWFQNSDKIDGKFLFYSFSAEQIQGFINESAGIGTVGTYTIESGKKTPILLPNQIEQAKVGEFFQQLDNLITLHQRELEKLQNIKKSMLEKMFV